MSSFAKSKLKAARDALGKKQYNTAHDAALQVLDYEPENYNAHVFLGLALLELGQHAKSEQFYRKAIELKSDQVLAWQGIAQLYERTVRREDLVDALEHMMRIYSTTSDGTKCAETLQKLIEIRREHGSRQQLVKALNYLLADSPLYSTLSSLPPPDATNPTSTSTFATQTAIYDSLPVIEEIISLTERDEELFSQSEFDKRRTRLGGPSPDQLRKDIGVEVWAVSKLPSLYQEVLNHPGSSDELRRSTEAKLIRYRQQYFYSLPPSAPEKGILGAELDELVRGVVILEVPDELAWSIYLEGKDGDTIDSYGLHDLRRYIELLPTTALARLLRGYFLYAGIPLSEDEEEEGQQHQEPAIQDGEPLDVIIDAFALLQDSLLANRIVTEVYLQESDYVNILNVAESGLELVRRHEQNTGRKFREVRKAFNVALATALVHLYPPKHHPRALRLLDDVLRQDPSNVKALVGRGYVLQHSEKWEGAEALFTKAASLAPASYEESIRAREEAAWCRSRTQVKDGIQALKDVLIELEGEDHEMDRARCLWRIGKCCLDMGDGFREEAFTHFIQSLKCDRTYAPSYTSLGIYYSEFADPPDPARASRCFQKAFELDSREADAARRLAEGFADEREWDLVEVVARRTIDGEGGLDAGVQTGDSVVVGKYLPTNGWAWKALGVVELSRGNYAPSVEAFQVALRADPDDQLSWVRLGEAYSKAGRHAAAYKALARAHELKPDDWMCTYLIGEVQRQTGRLAEALDSFESIRHIRPNEIGVITSIAQTHLDLARQESLTGFLARAEQSFVAAIVTSLRMSQERSGHGGVAWKILADALLGLSKTMTFVDEDPVSDVVRQIGGLLEGRTSTRIAQVFSFNRVADDTALTGRHAREVAIAAYDYRITIATPEDIALGSSLFDLGVALYAWSTDGNGRESASEKATSLLKQALQKEPGNTTFWIALGNMYLPDKPKASQHAYIRALELDPKNVTAWVNLGLLYLYHNDLELANEALLRAQVLDPDYTLAWVGQALVATANGHDVDARTLLEHASGLTADIPLADLEFASRVFSSPYTRTSIGGARQDEVLPAFFVLTRYAQRCPQDPCALHLLGLLCELLGQLEQGSQWILQAITLLEAAYEESEDPVVERQFTIAHSNLARLKLGLLDCAGALESFETALGLIPEQNVNKDPESKILRVQALFGCGLAHFRLGDLRAAMTAFQAALDSAGEDHVLGGHVTVLLAQTMWAIGTDEFKESAKALLLDSITSDPENLMAINTLAGMSILTEDDSLVDAALSEIQSLPIERRQQLDPRKDVIYLLVQHHLGQGEVEQATRTMQRALHVEPSNLWLRRNLASLALQQGDRQAIRAILGTNAPDTDITEARETLALAAVAEQGKEPLRCVQKAVMLNPGWLQNWQTLAYVRAREL